MRGGLSTVLDQAIERMGSGADVSMTWLRRSHPEHAAAVAEALSIQRVLADGAAGPPKAGAYRVADLIGRGGMGAVYLAHAPDPAVRPRTAAIKVMRPSIAADPRAVARFRREMRAGRRVRHPNVVWTLAGGVDRRQRPPLWYIVLEYAEGESLGALLERDGPLPADRARDILLQAARGLAAIHDADLVHRDVKPENLILTRDGVVKVADLGVVAMAERRAPDAGGASFAGSPLYAAPEQFVADEQALDGRADLYALGGTMFELMTGSRPPGAGAATRAARVSDARPGVPPLLDELIAAMTEPDRRRRPRSAAEVVRILEEGDASPWLARRVAIRRLPEDSPIRRALPAEDAAFVDRDAALGVLEDAWREALAGRGGCVFVTGSAGSGKSRLVAELCLRLTGSESPVHVLHGGFDPGGADSTLGAFRSALRRHARDRDLAAACDAWLGSTPALAAPLCRLIDDAPAPGDAQLLTRDVIPGAFADALTAIATTSPTLLVVEDLHFAEKDAHAILRAVSAAAAGVRFLVVATSRAESARPPGATPLALGPISHQGTLAFVREALGLGRSADRLARRLADETERSPQHLRLAVRHLTAEHRIRRRANGSWDLRRADETLPVPPDVEDAARIALSRLSPRDLDLVQAAAVQGFGFDPVLLATVTRRDLVSVVDDLRRIETAHGLVRTVPEGASFEHHQIHRIAYDGVGRARRRRLHRDLAAELERSLRGAPAAAAPIADDPRALDVCRHYLRSETPASSAAYLLPALARLSATGRGAEGLALARTALRRILGLAPEQRIRVLLWVSRASSDPTSMAAATQAEAASRALGDDGLSAESLVTLANEISVRRDPERACTLLREAVAISQRTGLADVERRAHAALCQIEARLGRPDRAISHGRRAVAIASADERSNAECLRSLSDVLRFFGDPHQALEIARASVDAAVRSESVLHVGIAETVLGCALCATGDASAGAEHLRTAAESLHSVGSYRRESFAVGLLGSALMSRGEWTAARDASLRSVELATRLKTGQLAALLGGLAEAYYRTGDLDRALTASQRSFRVSRARSYRLTIGQVLEHRGRILLALGEHARALRDFEAAATSLAAMGKHAMAAEQGANVAGVLAELGRFDDAESRCRDALARQLTCSQPSDVPGTRLRLAQILIARGDSDAAAAEVRSAQSDASTTDDADGRFRCTIIEAVVLGRGATAAIESVRAGIETACVPSRLLAELALWDLTKARVHAAGALRVLRQLVDGASPRYRESMVASMATYRRVLDAAREAGVRGVCP